MKHMRHCASGMKRLPLLKEVHVRPALTCGEIWLIASASRPRKCKTLATRTTVDQSVDNSEQILSAESQ